MRKYLPVMAALVMVAGPAIAAEPAKSNDAAATAAATAAPKYTTEDTDIGTLLDDPAAKAILDKHLPEVSSSDQIDMARAMTLKAIQTYAPDDITDEALAAIDADLAKLPRS